jgi:hypothetical protein
MSEGELRRLRNDLEVMEQAAGLRLPLGWTDVWLTLLLVPCGAILSAWAAFAPGEYRGWGLVPLLGLLLAGGTRWARQSRGGAVNRRERTFAAVSVLVVAAGMAGLIIWEKALGLPSRAVRGAGLSLVGVMLIPLALSSRARRSALAGAVALIPFGLIAPLCSPTQLAVAGGFAVMLAGLVGAGIQAWQLHSDRREHGPAH